MGVPEPHSTIGPHRARRRQCQAGVKGAIRVNRRMETNLPMCSPRGTAWRRITGFFGPHISTWTTAHKQSGGGGDRRGRGPPVVRGMARHAGRQGLRAGRGSDRSAPLGRMCGWPRSSYRRVGRLRPEGVLGRGSRALMSITGDRSTAVCSARRSSATWKRRSPSRSTSRPSPCSPRCPWRSGRPRPELRPSVRKPVGNRPVGAHGWLAERSQESAGAIARGESASATSRSGSGRSR
jgi:hypothetical protein